MCSTMHILKKITLLNLISLAFCYVISDVSNKNVSGDKFDYFAYGSNLLAKRIHIGNPSAKFYSAAKLKGYRLDFNMRTDNWRGAVATICEDPDSHVWGALWNIDIKHLATLDKQEGVDIDWYYPLNVTVTTDNGTRVEARTYIETIPCPPRVNELPPERQPSATYHKVIVDGATECGLPAEYIKYLNDTIKTNGLLASDTIIKQLGNSFR